MMHGQKNIRLYFRALQITDYNVAHARCKMDI